jgi:hypothetical protein
LILFFKNESVENKSNSIFLDTLDQNLDLSTWLTSRYGILPIASLITEPALGYGFSIIANLLFALQSNSVE